ncbi:hypothetical protein JKP88DRAFT_268875, partial [Tribonema minus]
MARVQNQWQSNGVTDGEIERRNRCPSRPRTGFDGREGAPQRRRRRRQRQRRNGTVAQPATPALLRIAAQHQRQQRAAPAGSLSAASLHGKAAQHGGSRAADDGPVSATAAVKPQRYQMHRQLAVAHNAA